jgi:hypothetical protein
MLKNKYLFFLFSVSFSMYLFSANNVFANPAISSFLLNGTAENLTFNPESGESVSIEVKANVPVKFTRLYICSIDQACNGTSGNYTRYFTQSSISDTVTKLWNGKKTGDIEIVPEGEYKIMASMTEGTNSPVTEFGQYSIFINFSNVNATSSDIVENSSSTVVSIIPNTPIPHISSHSETEDLSDYDEKTEFEITAGRERMATVGSPLEFNANYNLLQKDQCVPNFKWSFGDGFENSGKDVKHAYKYSGEYQVVLNAICGDYNSVSRTNVVVIFPNLSILSILNGDFEIKNNSKTEINIGLWKIKGGQKDFIFPQDTIISVNKKIILSKEDFSTSSSTTRISLNNSSDGEVAFTNNNFTQNSVISLQNTNNQEIMSVAEAEKLAKDYKEKLALNDKSENITKDVVFEDINNDLIDNKNIPQTATVLNSIDSSSTKNFWSKLIDIPINSFKSILYMFYDF